jgi:hypothetical protein
MKLVQYLSSRGLPQRVIEELLRYIPSRKREHVFYDGARIKDPDKWFYWPGQTRFVPIGQCPNGDAVAVDSQREPGAVFYVAHELVGTGQPLERIVVRVAGSPSEFIKSFLEETDFPFDYWETKSRGTEPVASPNRRPARRLAIRGSRRRGGR